MGKGSSQPTQSTVTQTNLPDWLRGPVLDAVGRAGAIAEQPYTPYPYERIAGFTPAQDQVSQNIMGLQSPNQFAFGSGLAASAGEQSLNMGAQGYTPGQFNPQQVQPGQLDPLRMATPQTFGQQQAEQYMSPYMQSVIDVAKRSAISDAQKAQLQTNLGAARQGTYGGSRQLLAALQREEDLNENLSDIQTRGLQASFENAQQQFGADRAALMSADQTNLQAGLGQQQLGFEGGLRAMISNQQTGLEAQRLGEQSRQFGAQQGLAALGQAGQLGQTLGNLGQFQQYADAQRLGLQQETADRYQGLEQQRLDQLYADFLRQRDYPMETLGFYSNIIRGLPANTSSSQITYAPPTSPLSYLTAGLGSLAGRSIVGG
jgi:hypothetical protein